MFRRGGETLVGRACRDDANTVSKTLQRGGDPLEDQRMIVDDEYFQRHGSLCVSLSLSGNSLTSRPMRPWSREL